MKIRKTAVLLAAAAVALTGCTAEGPGTPADANPSDEILIAIVTHGTAGDAFWDVVKSGAEQAAADLGVSITYQGDGDAVKQTELINAAVAQKPDGLVVSLANPEGVKDAVEAAVAAGIPAIATNRGGSNDEWKQYGMQTYVGQSELLAGEEVGARLASEGTRNVICVMHEAGNIGNVDRCNGVKNKLNGELSTVQVDIANLAEASTIIKSALLADPSIDGVVTLNPGVNSAALQAITESQSAAKLAVFELSTDTLDGILDGRILFAVDQQPYLQGYLPVALLAVQARNGDIAGGGQPIFTGPGFVTKDNAESIKKYAENGTR